MKLLLRRLLAYPSFEVYYSNHVEASQRDSITNTLGARAVMGTEKYLGLPSYIMSIYLLPNKLIDGIEKNYKCFLVGSWCNTRKGMHWLSSERLFVHKILEVWDSRILLTLMWRCLVNRVGSFKRTPIALILDCLKLIIFLTMIL